MTSTMNIPAMPNLASFAKAAELFDGVCAALGYKLVNMRVTIHTDVYVVMGYRDNDDTPEDRRYATWAGGVDWYDDDVRCHLYWGHYDMPRHRAHENFLERVPS